jgi:hypothetical protein
VSAAEAAASASGGRQTGRRPPCGTCDNGWMWVLVDIGALAIVDPRDPGQLVGPVVGMKTICVCQDDVNGEAGSLPMWFTPEEKEARAALKAIGQEPRLVDCPLRELTKRRAA